MDDMISRRAAINVIERNRAYIGHNMERAVGAAFIEILNCVGEDIGRLPSIQLATDKNVGTKVGTDLASLGTDCISRQSAIDVVSKWFEKIELNADICLDGLRQLPSAEPKIIRCKDCKNWDTTWTNDFSPNYHYCPMVDGVRKEDWFCADAERRTDEE